MENVQTGEKLQTPLSSKDFVIKLFENDGTKTQIKSIQQSKINHKPDSLIILTSNSIDSCIFRIPLRYFSVVLQSKKLTQFDFIVKGNELQTITRNFDKFRKINTLAPINSDYFIGYDYERSAVSLIYYNDIQAQTIHQKHNVQQFNLVLPPQAIFVDQRGIQQKQSIVNDVLANKSSILLLYDRLACFDCFEYFLDNRKLNIKEQPQQAYQPITSKYSYLKQLYPLYLLPANVKPEQTKLVAAALSFNLPSTFKQSDQFLTVICMAFPADAQRVAYNKQQIEQQFPTDKSLIKDVPDSTFLNNNIFVFNSKKLVCYTCINDYPDILTINQQQNTLYIGSSNTNICNIFKLEETQQGKLQMSKIGDVQHERIGACLQSVATCKDDCICLIDQINSVFCNKPGKKCSVVSLMCQNQINDLTLPVKALRQSSPASRKQVTFDNPNIGDQTLVLNDLQTSFHTKQDAIETELQNRLKNTKIPGVQNQMVSSLFSPANEKYIRQQYLKKQKNQQQNQNDEQSEDDDDISTLQQLAEKHNDTITSKMQDQELDNFQEEFIQYFTIYERLRLLEEFVCLILNPNMGNNDIQHLGGDTQEIINQHLADCAVTMNNSRYMIGYSEFYNSELKYINTKLKLILQQFEISLKLDFSQINLCYKFCSNDFQNSNFLAKLHHLLEQKLSSIQLTQKNVVQILNNEIKQNKRHGIQSSVIQLITDKTQQMTEYFRQCCYYKTKALNALYYAATHKLDIVEEQQSNYTGTNLEAEVLSQQIALLMNDMDTQDLEMDKINKIVNIGQFDKLPENLRIEMQKLLQKADKLYMKPNKNNNMAIGQLFNMLAKQIGEKQDYAQDGETDLMSKVTELQQQLETSKAKQVSQVANSQMQQSMKPQVQLPSVNKQETPKIQKNILKQTPTIPAKDQNKKQTTAAPNKVANEADEYTYDEEEYYSEISGDGNAKSSREKDSVDLLKKTKDLSPISKTQKTDQRKSKQSSGNQIITKSDVKENKKEDDEYTYEEVDEYTYESDQEPEASTTKKPTVVHQNDNAQDKSLTNVIESNQQQGKKENTQQQVVQSEQQIEKSVSNEKLIYIDDNVYKVVQSDGQTFIYDSEGKYVSETSISSKINKILNPNYIGRDQINIYDQNQSSQLVKEKGDQLHRYQQVKQNIYLNEGSEISLQQKNQQVPVTQASQSDIHTQATNNKIEQLKQQLLNDENLNSKAKQELLLNSSRNDKIDHIKKSLTSQDDQQDQQNCNDIDLLQEVELIPKQYSTSKFDNISNNQLINQHILGNKQNQMIDQLQQKQQSISQENQNSQENQSSDKQVTLKNGQLLDQDFTNQRPETDSAQDSVQHQTGFTEQEVVKSQAEQHIFQNNHKQQNNQEANLYCDDDQDKLLNSSNLVMSTKQQQLSQNSDENQPSLNCDNGKQQNAGQNQYNKYRKQFQQQASSYVSQLSHLYELNPQHNYTSVLNADFNIDNVIDSLQKMSREELEECFQKIKTAKQNLLTFNYKNKKSTFRKDILGLPKLPRNTFAHGIADKVENFEHQLNIQGKSLGDMLVSSQRK